jgi:hypothetical protein
MGHGLSPRSGESWTVDRTTATQLGPALAAAVGEHVGVPTGLLGAAGAGGVLTLPEEEALRGLAYLSLDPRSGAAVQEAVDGWAALHLGDGPGPEVTGAWVAAREYAQRLQHALAGYDARSDAVDRQLFYDMTVRFPAWAVEQVVEHRPGGGFVAGLIGVGVDAGAHLANADGSWVNPPDRGLVLDREDAAAAVARLVPATDPTGAEQLARQGRAAFDRTARALGVPAPPEPDTDPAHLYSDEPAEQAKAFVDGTHRVPE